MEEMIRGALRPVSAGKKGMAGRGSRRGRSTERGSGAWSGVACGAAEGGPRARLRHAEEDAVWGGWRSTVCGRAAAARKRRRRVAHGVGRGRENGESGGADGWVGLEGGAQLQRENKGERVTGGAHDGKWV
jgi:hypothetical protein